MSRKELIGKLTPAHFPQGERFDKAVFSSLITNLQKQLSIVWIQPVILLVFLGFGYLLSNGVGGFIGNIAAVACIFIGLIVGYLAVAGSGKRVKSACKTLGITMRDINTAIQLVKRGG